MERDGTNASERIRRLRTVGAHAAVVVRAIGAGGAVAVVLLGDHADAIVAPEFAAAFIVVSAVASTLATVLSGRARTRTTLVMGQVAADLCNMVLVVMVIDPGLRTGAWVLVLVPIGEAALFTQRPRNVVATSVAAVAALGASVWRADGFTADSLGRFAVIVFLAGGPASVFLTQGLIVQRALIRSNIDRDRLLEAATHDPLTGVLNRRGLVSARQDGRPLGAVLFLDLDGFKAINDTLGHDAGDEVLQIVARRYRSAVRADDALARLGGDEFAVMVHQTPPEQVAALADRLRSATRQPIAVRGVELAVDVSIGTALAVDPDTDLLTLLDAADAAMYVEKTGRRSDVDSAASRP